MFHERIRNQRKSSKWPIDIFFNNLLTSVVTAVSWSICIFKCLTFMEKCEKTFIYMIYLLPAFQSNFRFIAIRKKERNVEFHGIQFLIRLNRNLRQIQKISSFLFLIVVTVLSMNHNIFAEFF